jgi:hypothetical protein
VSLSVFLVFPESSVLYVRVGCEVSMVKYQWQHCRLRAGLAPTASLVVGLLLLSLLLIAFSPAVSGGPGEPELVFVDYTHGLDSREIMLQPGSYNGDFTDRIYNANGGAGSMRIALLWGGDPSDVFSFATTSPWAAEHHGSQPPEAVQAQARP